jgi:hypothetical protein
MSGYNPKWFFLIPMYDRDMGLEIRNLNEYIGEYK